MGQTTTFIIDVEADRPDKRQQLSHGLDFAMCMDGMRISAGQYEVTIRRLTVPTSEKAFMRTTLEYGEQRLYKKPPIDALRAMDHGWVESNTRNGCTYYVLTEEGRKRAEEFVREKQTT